MSVSVRWRPSEVPEAPGALLFVGPDIDIDSESIARLEEDREGRQDLLGALDIELWEAKVERRPRP